jgi:two-component system phosphate regulon sensor histidine kinase PhoR
VTIWVWILLAAALLFTVGYIVWRRWISPWPSLESLVHDIVQRRQPRTFLIGEANEPRRIGLALEELFNRQQHLDHQLAEHTSGTQTIATAMQDGLLVVDPSRRITLANTAFSAIFGLTNPIPAVPFLELVRNSDIDQLISETLRTGEPIRRELELATAPTQSPRFMQISAVATRNDQSDVSGAVVLFHDISELKQADQVRRDFVANVSHELRTPLSILRGYIETLLDDQEVSPDEFHRILDVMKKHSDRLSALTDDLLSLARLESGQPNVHFEELRPSELFAAIVRDWGKRFAEKKLSVEVALSSTLPAVQADPTRLQEVLYNLLDNAVKYSSPGGKIRLGATRTDDMVAISVSDTGTGIPEADLPRIFERFYRADKARSRELGGTGLGLSIVKHIAQMHGGKVEAESRPGRGTTIRLLLPIHQNRPTNAVTET